jgi:diguanylate cyclase (GGDEF)-like protein/PAS domain S-box-containing protein
MALKANEPSERRHLERLAFVPMAAALVLVWGGLAAFDLAERKSALEHVQSRLGSTVSTLADFNELAEASGANSPGRANASRTAAFWHALVEYPTASFWVESGGRAVVGRPPAAGAGPAVEAQDARSGFTVHAALPEADALVDWKRAMLQSVAALSAVTLFFLILARFLAQAVRQRAAAEREAAASGERAAQLALFRAELQQTVAVRTEELGRANANLETELAERRAAQEALREHDALLNAVTQSAAELLEAQSYEEAIATVLALIGKTISASRIQSATIAADRNGHFHASLKHEWRAPGLSPAIGDPAFQETDLSADSPDLIARLLAAGLASYFEDGIAKLHIPIFVAGALWGSLTFIDASKKRRTWSWAETDTLKTLAGLIGMAVTRARYLKELADANTIVQNSPTILYRLRAEPGFPLLYISNNIAKFGYDPAALVRTPHWSRALVDPRDRAMVAATMARILEPGAKGDAIEFRLRTGAGEVRWAENRYTPRRDENGLLLEVEGIVMDITDRKAAEAEIALLARTDSLTGLANRATFLERLRQSFADAARGAKTFAVLYLDLDHFKPVNDTLGHAAGDQLLHEVAERLEACARDTDLVARLGGDEFAVLQADSDEPVGSAVLAGRILHSLAQPFTIEGSEVNISASIGICPHTPLSFGPDEMLAQADLALYRSKEQGRGQYRFYSEDLDRDVVARVRLAADLRKALDAGELELYCEPQVELTTGAVADMKARVRWHHPARGLLMPDDFVPLLEKTATGAALGHWLLDGACKELCRRRNAGSVSRAVAVDLRFTQLENGDQTVDDVRGTLSKWGLAPSDLELDVTEETLAKVTLTRNDTLSRLHEFGVRIAIADFATKCSSFEYLRAYWIGRIKLSQPFISEALVDPGRAVTIHAVVQLARESGIGIITEGRETQAQRALLLASTQAPQKRTA